MEREQCPYQSQAGLPPDVGERPALVCTIVPMPQIVLAQLHEFFQDYNEVHPHKGLKMLPKGVRSQPISNRLVFALVTRLMSCSLHARVKSYLASHQFSHGKLNSPLPKFYTFGTKSASRISSYRLSRKKGVVYQFSSAKELKH